MSAAGSSPRPFGAMPPIRGTWWTVRFGLNTGASLRTHQHIERLASKVCISCLIEPSSFSTVTLVVPFAGVVSSVCTSRFKSVPSGSLTCQGPGVFLSISVPSPVVAFHDPSAAVRAGSAARYVQMSCSVNRSNSWGDSCVTVRHSGPHCSVCRRLVEPFHRP